MKMKIINLGCLENIIKRSLHLHFIKRLSFVMKVTSKTNCKFSCVVDVCCFTNLYL